MKAKIEAIDFESAAEDVRPYLQDPSELDMWKTKDFFRQMIPRIIFA